jgi:hypothetical protein
MSREKINELVAVHVMGWFMKGGKLWSPCHTDWSDTELSRWSGSVAPTTPPTLPQRGK